MPYDKKTLTVDKSVALSRIVELLFFNNLSRYLIAGVGKSAGYKNRTTIVECDI